MKSSKQNPLATLARGFRLIGVSKVHLHLILFMVSLVSLTPYLWALSTSLKLRTDVFNLDPTMDTAYAEHEQLPEVFSMAPFGKYLVNTIIVVLGILLIQELIIVLSAYVFARMRFRAASYLRCFWFR